MAIYPLGMGGWWEWGGGRCTIRGSEDLMRQGQALELVTVGQYCEGEHVFCTVVRFLLPLLILMYVIYRLFVPPGVPKPFVYLHIMVGVSVLAGVLAEFLPTGANILSGVLRLTMVSLLIAALVININLGP